MKKYYEVEIIIHKFEGEDILTVSGMVDGDETIYPVPDGWKGQQ